jgi:hypothetical protein
VRPYDETSLVFLFLEIFEGRCEDNRIKQFEVLDPHLIGNVSNSTHNVSGINFRAKANVTTNILFEIKRYNDGFMFHDLSNPICEIRAINVSKLDIPIDQNVPDMVYWPGYYYPMDECFSDTCCCDTATIKIESLQSQNMTISHEVQGKCDRNGTSSLKLLFPTNNSRWGPKVLKMRNSTLVKTLDGMLMINGECWRNFTEITEYHQVNDLVFSSKTKEKVVYTPDQVKARPNDWVGEYEMRDTCDSIDCCCPDGKIELTTKGAPNGFIIYKAEKFSSKEKCPGKLHEVIPLNTTDYEILQAKDFILTNTPSFIKYSNDTCSYLIRRPLPFLDNFKGIGELLRIFAMLALVAIIPCILVILIGYCIYQFFKNPKDCLKSCCDGISKLCDRL